MNEKGRSLISKICAILAIISLLVSDFLFVGTSLVSYALDVANTNNNNVVFTAYFRDGNGQTDKIQRNIDEGETKLYIDVTVKNEGYFNGQITLNNGSFDLKQEVNSEHISSINGNTVTLNQINAGSTVTIELAIQPKTTEAILNSETEIKLNGSYVNGKVAEKNKTIEVNGTAKVNLEWKSSTQTQAELESTILTNSIYKVNEEEKRVVQVLVNSKITVNNYPVKNTEVTLSVPENVQKVEVHARSTEATNKNINFNENNYTYNEQNKTLTINLSNENNTSWSKNAQDTFIVTYEFEKTENVTNKEITVNSTINTYDNKELKANQNVHIEKEIDGIVSSSIESVEEAIYKGKIYTGEERSYTEKNTINIDYVNDVDNLTIKGNEAVYLTDANESTGNIIYKETKINKQEFLRIFGQDGYLTVKNNGVIVSNINKNSETDENGNIVVSYSNQTKNIEITTSKPIAVGTLNIEHTKTILSTGYAREAIDKFTAIKESVSVNNTQATNKITLKNTESAADIKLKNVSKISTMADSQTLEIEAILDTSDESKELYKNPTVTITLPKEITILSVETPSVLYKNGLEAEKASKIKNDNGETQITLQFKGEQKNYDNYDGAEGTVINLKLEIKTDKLTPSKSSAIQMTYTNENKNQTKTASAEFEFESQYGLMIYNKASNYNNAKESVVTVNSEPTYGTIDTNSESKEVAINTAIINNYGDDIQNVVLIGTIPSNNSEDTYKAILNKVETGNSNAKISYSSKANAEANDNSWGEYTENAVSYKVEIPQMEKEETVAIKTSVTIPEKIGYNKNGSFFTKTSCIFQGQEQQNSSNIVLSTKANVASSAEALEINKETENKFIETTAIAGNAVLADNDNIYEGQTLKYKVIVTNNTGSDYSNVTVKARQKNGYVWDYIEKEVYNPHYQTKSNKSYYEVSNSNDITLGKIENFKNGESYTFEYEAATYLLDNENIDGTTTYGTIAVVSEDKNLSKTETTIKNNIKTGELQVKLLNGFDKDMNLTSGGDIKTLLSLTNTTNETLKDVEVKVAFSDNLTANISLNENNMKKVSYTGQDENKDGIKIITLKISSIEANETIDMELYSYTEKYLKNDEESIWILSQATTSNQNTYVSNKFTRTIYDNSHNIKLSQQGLYENGSKIDTEKSKVNDGDKIQLLATIANNEEKDIDVNIEYNLDRMIDIESAKIITTIGEEKDVIEQISYNNLSQNEQKIKPGETITIAMTGTVDALEIESLNNNLNVYDNSNGKTVNDKLSILVNTLHEQVEEPDEDDDEDEDEEVNPPSSGDNTNEPDAKEDNNNTNTNTNNNTSNNTNENTNGNNGTNTNNNKPSSNNNTTKIYTISGTAWLDQDRDGKKNSSEEKISEVTVEAINLGKGKVLASTKTDSNGEYKLTLEEGSYVLLFNYDNNLYTTTTYQVTGASETENSDAIERNVKFNGTTKKAGITDTIKLNSNIANLNLGLVLRSTFDLKLQKYVSKITVTNDVGTKTYEQPANTTLAKAEIKSKNLSGSLVVIEYKIKVTNVGDVAGYAKNIVDYMPSSLSFNSSMNSDWYLSGENLYNTSLANTKIEPGETKELTLVLTKTMTETNTGLINNKAAINESSNLLGIKDEKDDVGSADVIISVTTGALVSYVASTLITFIVLAGVAYFINKKYLSKRI